MAQNVIPARDFDLYISLPGLEVPIKIGTGVNFQASITGTSDDIGAFSTDDPIATDNGGNTYDLTFSLQQAEAIAIKNAISAVASGSPDTDGRFVHIRNIHESATISAVWHKKRDVPAESTIETYSQCTGIEESDAVERRSIETHKTWRFRARGMTRRTVPYTSAGNLFASA